MQQIFATAEDQQQQHRLSAPFRLALPPGNAAEFLQEVRVPAGTMLQSSIAAEAFGQPGGLLEFELLERINPKFFGPGTPFP
jgi:hypothetical protein